MPKIILFFVAALMHPLVPVQAQEVKAQVLDASTKAPVAFAHVLFSSDRGVVTNEEGFFSYTPEKEGEPVLLKVGSLGYEQTEIDPTKIKNGRIFLKPSLMELDEVILSAEDLSPAEIVERARERVDENYEFGIRKRKVFYRKSDVSQIRKFDLHVDQSTIAGIDQNLMDQIINEIPKTSDSYKEVLGNLYGNYSDQKIHVVKAANLHDPASTERLDQLTGRLEELFRESLKHRSYLKIRSGILGVKMDAEELEEELEEDQENPSLETEQPEELDPDQIRGDAAGNIRHLLSGMFWKVDLPFDVFDKIRKYRFSLNGFARFNGSSVYVIEFEPKRGADFRGRIFIDALDFGVHRVDFENVKPLKKFKLFGISTSKDVHRGRMIFARNGSQKYVPSYLELETGQSFGIDRPLTIIEKNKFTPGRRKQNELNLDIRLQVRQLQKFQLVVFSDESFDSDGYDALSPPKSFELKTFKKYDPDFWRGYDIMEPNTAIQQFTALEEGSKGG